MESRNFLNRFAIAWLSLVAAACNAPTTTDLTSLSSTTSTGTTFASGTKVVKVITSNNSTTGSFTLPAALPVTTPIPATYPGYDGTETYLPGVSASRYFDTDGTTQISKPSWLLDVQLGVTTIGTSASCAKFGNSGASGKDVSEFYRVSESDCSSSEDGTGSGLDPVFARVVLSRDSTVLGTAENLMIQVEYQASGLHLNTDGSTTDVEQNVDQLWKVFWNSTLASGTAAKVFSVFIPPNFSACKQSGAGADGPGNCSSTTYTGSPVQTKQIIIPLSALPTASVIQLTRVRSRISATAPDNYVTSSFCRAVDGTGNNTNSPLCLGVVIRSITIMRI